MPPKSPKTKSSRWRGKRFVIPKIALRNSPGFFQEYFYYLLAAITLGMMLLLKGGGMSGSSAIVISLWIAAILWFAQQARGYFMEKRKATGKGPGTKPPAGDATTPKKKWEPPKGMKPMIGPQWPVNPSGTAAESSSTPTEEEESRRTGFIFERPTSPGRKPKLPANWGPKGKRK